MSLASHFLIARPSLQDPNFLQTVILLLQHDSSGAFGLIVNRPLPPKAWSLPFPLYLGGPCKSEGLMMLHGNEEWANDGSQAERRVAPGIFIGDEECVKQATNSFAGESEDAQNFLMMTGYSGWAPGQLENEISEGAWAILKATSTNLFQLSSADKWASLLPSIIPQPSNN